MPTPEAAARPWQTHTVAIRDVRREVEGVSTYDLAFLDDTVREAYRFAPGQFNMLYLPGAGEIAISVSDDPRNTEAYGHTIRVAGNVTRTLAGLGVGETLGLRGPFGTSWPLSECIGRDVVIVCGGIGLAPLRPAICTLLQDRQQFGRLNLLYGARSSDTLLFEREYDDWSRQGMDVQTTVDRSSPGWLGNVGVVTLLLDQLPSFDPHNTVLMCCGPEVMMKFTVMAALNSGLSEQQIWVSMERNMQCAVGLCGHCQLGPTFICKDGPVFRYDKIAPFIDVEGL
ncbi:MAG: FAD/NAD(P)-binding protein [Planctomycetes bacterium]|nr:FAD/NAD(P)-binding protein [Planctomycetota bacterium]